MGTLVQCCLQLSWDDPGMLLCNVGVLKTASAVYHSPAAVACSWMVRGLGPSVTVKVRTRAREW